MKKISILTTLLLMITITAFAIMPEKKNRRTLPHCIITQNKIDVVFTNKLTSDSLAIIKNQLGSKGITIDYQRLTFDDKNQLIYISCKVADNKTSGSFTAPIDDKLRFGFYFDYKPKAKTKFAIGGIFN